MILPEEMIEEILKRLPVRSLVRFSCTCKRWRSLIFFDSKFNKSHIALAKRPSWKYQEILLSGRFERTVDCDCNIVKLLPNETLTCYIPIMLGSCNGILFVHDRGVSGLDDRAYVLWNPYTNSVTRIFNGLVLEIGCSRMGGLSYDHASDDYKAVIILIGFRFLSPYVFSLRRNSWNKLPDLTFDIKDTWKTDLGYDRFGITPDNGICYWQIIKEDDERSRSSSIICFDPAVEKFKDVPLPDEWRCSSSARQLFQIGALDRCLSLIHMNIIWVMKEYESWSKMHVLQLSYIERMGEIKTYKPLGYNSTKDQVVMLARGPGDFRWRFRIADINKGVLRDPSYEDERFKKIIFTNYFLVLYNESLLCPWLDTLL